MKQTVITTKQLSQNSDKKKIEYIVKASKIGEDTLHKKLTPLLENDSVLKVKYLISCTKKYCFTEGVLKDEPEQKRRRPFGELKFDSETPCHFLLKKLVITVMLAKKNKIYKIKNAINILVNGEMRFYHNLLERKMISWFADIIKIEKRIFI